MAGPFYLTTQCHSFERHWVAIGAVSLAGQVRERTLAAENAAIMSRSRACVLVGSRSPPDQQFGAICEPPDVAATPMATPSAGQQKFSTVLDSIPVLLYPLEPVVHEIDLLLQILDLGCYVVEFSVVVVAGGPF